jgi:hypothetical protein
MLFEDDNIYAGIRERSWYYKIFKEIIRVGKYYFS